MSVLRSELSPGFSPSGVFSPGATGQQVNAPLKRKDGSSGATLSAVKDNPLKDVRRQLLPEDHGSPVRSKVRDGELSSLQVLAMASAEKPRVPTSMLPPTDCSPDLSLLVDHDLSFSTLRDLQRYHATPSSLDKTLHMMSPIQPVSIPSLFQSRPCHADRSMILLSHRSSKPPMMRR